MPPDVRDPTDPKEWLRRARASLALARAGRPSEEVVYEDLCYCAQQAAEKASKAVLVLRQVDFPKTHVIERLLRLVEDTGITVPPEVRDGAGLTEYATRARYPGGEDASEEEYRRAVAVAEQVVRWAEGIVAGDRA